MKPSVYKILILAAVGLAGVFFARPSHAAVPVAVVQFDAGTAFESSIIWFLGHLMDALELKRSESTAAYELLKIEKAREDVNKLVQEVQEELTDYGQVLLAVDPRLQDDPVCIADPANCQETNDAQRITISPFKDSRIIHNVYDYLFEEPRERARVYTMCYFNVLIWDQAGYLSTLLGDTGFETEPVDPALKKELQQVQQECGGGNIGAKCSFGDSTLESINNLRATRDAILYSLKRSNYYQIDFPQIFLFGDWAGYSDTDDPTLKLYGRADRGEAESKRLALMSLKNCAPVLSQGTAPVIPDPAIAFHNLTTENVASILPTLAQAVNERSNVSWNDLRLAKENRNNLDGVARNIVRDLDRLIDEAEKERELTYLAGQGIRPERLYLEVNTRGEQTAFDNFDPISAQVKYQYDTGYIISPAVVLLQKMQAANQAMFDLAQKSFLYLDPELTRDNILSRYGVATNDRCFDDAGNQLACSEIDSSEAIRKRRICNFPAPDSDVSPQCVVLEPWLRPIRSFKSAPDAQRVGPRTVGARRVVESGLPAPWEDGREYLALGNEKAGGEFPYELQRYRDGAIIGGTKGDNIGSKILGADFAINDWYDRVFEMYEPRRDPGKLQFDRIDWQCYLATWFTVPRSPIFIDSDDVPDAFTQLSLRTYDPNFLSERHALAEFKTDFDGDITNERLITRYCRERLADESY